MAARWGTGEEILTAHNMEFFSTSSLDEADALQGALAVDCTVDHGLHVGDVVETLHGCLDPSILSIFEDPPTGEAKIGIDEESEATLLTALTEVLDNVDDENLSPFDTLPDVELLTGQKGHEHSPLRKLFCLSRSPPDRESMFNTRSFSSPGKSLPRMPSVTIQRSDGEDEEEATHLSDIEPTVDLLDWSGVALEQDGSCVSVTLGDLVKHMHCMAVCLEDGADEQMLPEGGILLEVVDQGEHGEPILAIPDLSFELPSAGSCQEVPDQTPVASPQHPTMEAEASASPSPQPGLEGQEEKVVIKRPKEEVTEKCPSRRKKKRKNKEVQPPPVSEGRVLRSATKDLEKKTQEEQHQKQQKMKKVVTLAPAVSTLASQKGAPVPQAAVIDHPQVMPQTPIDMNPAPKSDELRMDATAPKHSPALESAPVPAPSTVPVPVPVPSAVPSVVSVDTCVQEKSPKEGVASVASEPKPKPLSLQQYRLLRQQKRPAPLEKAGDNSTKWPTLPEAPKELPPIPCLPQPSPKDPRKASAPAATKEPAPEVKAVWQPKGLAAPPTPEALLVPPASLVATSSKPAVPKPAPVQASALASPVPVPAPVPASAPVPTPTPSLQPQPQPQSQSPAPLASSQNTTTSQASLCPPQPATVQPAVYKDTPLPSATTPTASQVLKAIVSQPRIAQLLAAALKGQKLPLVSPQVRSDAPASQAQSDVYPRTTTEVQPAAAVIVTAATTPQKVVVAAPAAVSVAPSQAIKRPEQPTVAPKSEPAKVALPVTVTQQRQVPGVAALPVAVPTPPVVAAQSQFRALSANPAQQKQTPAVLPPKGKSQTEELIESFTSEIGIEASDLASLLEQFEETQAKVERSVPEVFGRAAAVGNSSVEPAMESKAVEGTKVHDLGSTAGLTPPGTPPHQMWKPLVPAVLQGRSRTTDGTKQTPTKLTIQIDPRPLPANKLRGKAQPVASNPAAFQPFSRDHDYCLPSKDSSSEAGKRFNIKQQPSITIKTVELPSQQSTTQCPPAVDMHSKPTSGAPHRLDEQALASSVLVTPDASPSRVEPEGARMRSPKRECFSGHQLHSPSPCCRKRGRARRRQSDHSRSNSSCSDSSSRSSSRSQSRSPPRKRCYRSRRSESTSSSRSRSRSRSQSHSPQRRRRYSYSSSRSGSWSRSRSRSNSPDSHRYWRSEHIPRSSRYVNRERHEETKRRKEKAIEERRVVYVGRIRGGMTRAELKERFSLYGEIEDCTLHFREHGDNYGFVTYYDTKDAFTAIENGSKLRRPNELPFDLCFGGRRQFCKTSYADLDSSREYDPTSTKRRIDALDFDTLLKQAQRNLKR